MKNSNYLVLFFAFSIYLCFPIKGVYSQGTSKIHDPRTSEILEISDNINEYGRITFKKYNSLYASDLFVNYKTAFGLGANDEMVLTKARKGKSGNMHYRYQQYYKGIKVETCEYLVHERNGELSTSLGKIVNDLNIDLAGKITESEALEIALKEINASRYAWQDSIWEQGYKEDLNDSEASWYPKSKTVITKLSSKNGEAEEFSLAHKFRVRSLIPDDNINIYIDAINGEVIKSYSINSKADGSVTTVYNGFKYFTVDYTWWPTGRYFLSDDSRSSTIETKNATYDGNCTPYWFGSQPHIFSIGDSYWTASEDYHAASAHWAAQNVYKYFVDKHSRTHGMRESSGYSIRIYNNNWQGPMNVSVDGIGDLIYVGKHIGSSATNYAGSLDVIGHEFTHGIANYSSDVLEYDLDDYESGAIIESFCDIFGECVENYILGSADWIGGSDLHDDVKRSFVSPSSYPRHDITKLYSGCFSYDATYSNERDYPEVYDDANWIDDVESQEARYSNLMVMNRWFYLLVNGGTQNGITVNGIGISKAEEIVYEMLCSYASISSTFNSVAGDADEVGEDLYGSASCENRAMRNAWAAVGIGTVQSPNTPSGETSPEVDEDETYTTYSFSGATSYQWEIYDDYNLNYRTTSTPSVTYAWDDPVPGWIRVRAINSCYTSGWSGKLNVLPED